MKCYLCHRGIKTGDTLHRINPKGEVGVWACEVRRPPSHTVSPAVRLIEAALSHDDDEDDEVHRDQ